MPQNHDLRGRIAGQSAMAAVIEAQSHRAPRRRLARIFGASPLAAEGKAHYRGAVGELLVGSILDRLGHSWDVLHGVPLGASSLDHFAVGRAGVFACVVRNCQGGEVAVNGDEIVISKSVDRGILDARAAARTVSAALTAATETPVTVTGVLVLVEPTKVAVLQAPDDVHVLTSMQLEQWLLSSPAVLSGADVAQISAVAELNQTWPQPQQAARKARNLTRAFVRIHHEVRSAAVRRFFWVVAALSATFLWVWVLVSILTSLVVNSS
ncbi:NERD domain-containing protein [Salinibacterium sp. PAMC 21357]|uniref:NERD domain-containing protein n=1 Tax=Salinibacterium sp. PAMC 21357 TaxID=1112215 RepID=UPI0003164029|nr:NERD domain-containing protein [Salinibacterium sp. PAMC 21357]